MFTRKIKNIWLGGLRLLYLEKLKIKHMIDFEMYTPEGNQACNEAFRNIKALIEGDKFISEDELKKFVKEQIDQVALVHSEVNDTEPEYHFEDKINETLEAKGYAYRVDRYKDF